LIDTCIETGRLEPETDDGYFEKTVSSITSGREDQQRYLSAREMIDVLRMLPFPYRCVYNLSVLDGFCHGDISRKLSITLHEVEANLKISREKLRRIVLPQTNMTALS
jgi:DNA-directed RNA polymerase specialized sigma24 family protein